MVTALVTMRFRKVSRAWAALLVCVLVAGGLNPGMQLCVPRDGDFDRHHADGHDHGPLPDHQRHPAAHSPGGYNCCGSCVATPIFTAAVGRVRPPVEAESLSPDCPMQCLSASAPEHGVPRPLFAGTRERVPAFLVHSLACALTTCLLI